MTTTFAPSVETVDWLLAGDPAIRWQTMRDIVGAPARAVERQRDKVGTDGWGWWNSE